MAYRSDFYSDEEYEYALQMEEDAYREQLDYDEAFLQYCEEEYRKELEGENIMRDKIYVLEKETVDGVEVIACASSQSIAEDMKNAAIESGKCKLCDINEYQMELDHMEVAGEVIHFKEDEPEYRMHPMSAREIRENMDENGFVTGKVLVHVSEMVNFDIEELMDYLSESLVGSPLLSSVDYSVAGAIPETNSIIIEVTGSVELVLAELEEEEERDYDEE